MQCPSVNCDVASTILGTNGPRERLSCNKNQSHYMLCQKAPREQVKWQKTTAQTNQRDRFVTTQCKDTRGHILILK